MQRKTVCRAISSTCGRVRKPHHEKLESHKIKHVWEETSGAGAGEPQPRMATVAWTLRPVPNCFCWPTLAARCSHCWAGATSRAGATSHAAWRCRHGPGTAGAPTASPRTGTRCHGHHRQREPCGRVVSGEPGQRHRREEWGPDLASYGACGTGRA